jgi:hypothetical protein
MSAAPSLAVTVVADEPVAAGSCAVCPHPLAAHDAISLRFCRASEAQATTTRGCVCPST